MKYYSFVVALFAFVASIVSATDSKGWFAEEAIIPKNNCVSFSISSGTGCAWMCNYCASQLGTNNYYFTTDVCTYQAGGCVGNPFTGVTYTCCSL
jgi:adenine C2-methylase RlmN of 23S rRNA A2503 and tRNA A37